MVGGTWLQALQAFYDTVGAILEAGEGGSVDIFEIKLAFVAATRECSRPAQPAPSEASRPRFDVDGSGDIDGEELGAVAAELGMAMSAAEVRHRWRQHMHRNEQYHKERGRGSNRKGQRRGHRRLERARGR